MEVRRRVEVTDILSSLLCCQVHVATIYSVSMLTIFTLFSQLSPSEVELKCNGTYCTFPPSLVLSNSVQFQFNNPEPQQRYKVKPRITAMLPLNFFYPLTSSSVEVLGGRFVVFAVILRTLL